MTQIPIMTFLATLLLIYACSYYSDLLSHSLIDIFIVSVSWGIFIITWNSRNRFKTHFYLFWGLSFLFYGFITLFSFFCNEGIDILDGSTCLSFIFWVLGGYYFSINLWIATLFIEHPLNYQKGFNSLLLITVLIIGLALSDVFPVCQMGFYQLNFFYVINEFAICLICLSTFKKIVHQKHHFSLRVFSNIKQGLFFFIVTRVCSLFDTSNYPFIFLLYHFLQFVSLYYIYQIFFNVGFSRPVNSTFNELIQKQKAAKDSEKNFRLLFEHMNEGVAYHQIVTDSKGKPVDYIFLDMNESFEKQTGLSRCELIGKHFSKALPNIYKEAFDWVQKYGQVALEGKNLTFELYSKHLNQWFHVSAYCPEIGFFATIVKDITQKKMDEMHRKEKQHKLAQNMKSSRQEIYEQDLSLQKIKNEYKEFTCILSHDLCEPLRNIYNLSRLLKEDLLANELNDVDILLSLDQLSHLSQDTHGRIIAIMGMLQKNKKNTHNQVS